MRTVTPFRSWISTPALWLARLPGFRDAHAIALDDTGTYGYVSDGPADAVTVFDRGTLKAEATIQIGCSPRFIAFEPQSRLLLAFCSPGSSSAAAPKPRPGERRVLPASPGLAHLLAIDTAKNTVLADIALNGDFRIAQPDGSGSVYATVARPAAIAQFDATGIAAAVQGKNAAGTVHLDWSRSGQSQGLMHFIPLPSSCENPQGLAVDGKDLRLFVACENQTLAVLNANHGEPVASLITGPGDDVIGYDAGRGLIYSANGGGYGSLTIIQQDANTDSYAVIQNLPTLARARTLAVDPSAASSTWLQTCAGLTLRKWAASERCTSIPFRVASR